MRSRVGDQAPMAHVTRVVAIASTPRSGSTLIGRAMHATGQLGDPHEHFNPYRMAVARSTYGCPTLTPIGYASRVRSRIQRRPPSTHRYTTDSMRRYLAMLATNTATRNGVVSVKTHWTHFSLTMLAKGLDLDVFGAPVTWVCSQRRDRLRQAVSYVRAMQTQQWTATSTRMFSPPEYDAALIRSTLNSLETMEASWVGYLASIGATPHVVTYEDLDADYEGTMAALFAHVGVDAPVPPRQIERQSDALNDEWVRRFLDENGDRSLDAV